MNGNTTDKRSIDLTVAFLGAFTRSYVDMITYAKKPNMELVLGAIRNSFQNLAMADLDPANIDYGLVSLFLGYAGISQGSLIIAWENIERQSRRKRKGPKDLGERNRDRFMEWLSKKCKRNVRK